jgi:hypothetical protein
MYRTAGKTGSVSDHEAPSELIITLTITWMSHMSPIWGPFHGLSLSNPKKGIILPELLFDPLWGPKQISTDWR